MKDLNLKRARVARGTVGFVAVAAMASSALLFQNCAFQAAPAVSATSSRASELVRSLDAQTTQPSAKPTGEQIRQLAIDVLGRSPDSLTADDAAKQWRGLTDRGLDLEGVRRVFAASDEAAIRIHGLALNAFGAGASGLTPARARLNWSHVLAGGGSLDDVAKRMADRRPQPTLDDLFAGRAEFEPIEKAEKVVFNFATPGAYTFGAKASLIPDPRDPEGRVLAFIRVSRVDELEDWDVAVLSSSDGVTFYQEGPNVFASLKAKLARPSDRVFYDPHVAVDRSGPRPVYVMAMECAWTGRYGASLCLSTSTNPADPTSWSEPSPVVRNDGPRSASTGAVLVDGARKFVKWTVVDDGKTSPLPDGTIPDDGDESTSTFATELRDYSSELGGAAHAGRLLMGAQPDVHCTGWECNNVDVQDWKRVRDRYYAVYNGGNYFRCMRPVAEASRSSEWALAIRRSDSPLGDYSESTGVLIAAPLRDTCGISYPTLEEVGGETYLYYTYITRPAGLDHHNQVRSRLVWSSAPVARVGAGRVSLPKTPWYESPSETLFRRYFKELLGREGTDREIQDWVEAAKHYPDKELRATDWFWRMPEARNRLRSLPSNGSIVDVLYRTFLARDPEPAGRAYWVGFLDRGSPVDHLLGGFNRADEFGRVSAREMINHLWKGLLGRPIPDWYVDSEVQRARDARYSAEDYARFLMSSDEFRARWASFESRRDPWGKVETMRKAILFHGSSPQLEEQLASMLFVERLTAFDMAERLFTTDQWKKGSLTLAH